MGCTYGAQPPILVVAIPCRPSLVHASLMSLLGFAFMLHCQRCSSHMPGHLWWMGTRCACNAGAGTHFRALVPCIGVLACMCWFGFVTAFCQCGMLFDASTNIQLPHLAGVMPGFASFTACYARMPAYSCRATCRAHQFLTSQVD